MNTVMARRRSILLMAICATLWSIAGIFIKMIPWNPFVIAGARSLISALLVAAFMLVKKIPFRFNRKSLVSGMLLAMTFLAFVTANKLTTSANAIVLQFTAPVFIVLISFVVLGQRFRRSDYVVVGITMAGIALCFCDQLSSGNMLGNCIGVLSGLFMAGMFVATGEADEDSRMTGIFLGQIFTAAVGLPTVLLFDTPVTPQAIWSIVILGVFQLGIPYILYGLAVKDCPALICCLIGAIEPLLNPLWVFLFDGEAPGVFALVGGALVIGNITVWCIRNEKQAAADAP